MNSSLPRRNRYRQYTLARGRLRFFEIVAMTFNEIRQMGSSLRFDIVCKTSLLKNDRNNPIDRWFQVKSNTNQY